MEDIDHFEKYVLGTCLPRKYFHEGNDLREIWDKRNLDHVSHWS